MMLRVAFTRSALLQVMVPTLNGTLAEIVRPVVTSLAHHSTLLDTLVSKMTKAPVLSDHAVLTATTLMGAARPYAASRLVPLLP